MRFIKALLLVLLVCVSCLLLLGVFMPEVDFMVKTSVKRPSVAVFASVIDPNSMPEWIDGLESVERKSGILSFPGSTFELIVNEKEMKTRYLLEILEVMPLDYVKVKMTNDNVNIETSMKLIPNGLDTDVEMYVQIKGQDLLSRAFIALMQSSIADDTQAKLDNFKRFQEQQN